MLKKKNHNTKNEHVKSFSNCRIIIFANKSFLFLQFQVIYSLYQYDIQLSFKLQVTRSFLPGDL